MKKVPAAEAPVQGLSRRDQALGAGAMVHGCLRRQRASTRRRRRRCAHPARRHRQRSAGSTAGSARGCLADADGADAGRGGRTRAVEFLPVVPAEHPGRLGVVSSYLMAATFTFGAAMTLRAGGHIRVVAAAGECAAAGAAAAGDRSRRRWRSSSWRFLACAMANFTWRRFASGPDLDLERDAGLDPAGRRHLRHGSADAAVPRALHPGAARPAARGSSA